MKNGITLVALVVTIIVLLILAGVAISLTVGNNGLFRRAEQATNEYSEARAREELTLVLSDAQMKKYESGLTEAELDAEIAKVGTLLPKTDPASNIQQVIVGEYIFEIDRSVPEITDRGCVGKANEVIVTATITQNGNWQNPVATVTGTITKYGGGSVTNVTATATNGVTITGLPTNGGSYTITEIKKDTVITITTTDSEGKTKTHTIPVNLVRDNTAPEISGQSATASGLKIKIKANAVDDESKLKPQGLTYTVTCPEGGTITEGTTGYLDTGVEKVLTTSKPGTYTVTFTAEDNAGNKKTTEGIPVTTSDAMSISELKEQIKQGKYAELIGTKVDYKPAGGTWRLFYVEDSTNTFGDGAGTIYLKRDYDSKMNLSNYIFNGMTENGLTMMKKLNPKWKKYGTNSSKTKDSTFLDNEKAAAGLCDTENWTNYCDTTVARYAIGAAPLEMWCKAQNVYKAKYDTSTSTIDCDIKNESGYGYKIDGGDLIDWKDFAVVNTNIEQSKVIAHPEKTWLASPSSSHPNYICMVKSDMVQFHGGGDAIGFTPVVALKP